MKPALKRMCSAGFVSDGLRRLLNDPTYRQQSAAEESRIREQYAAELSAAKGFWERKAVERKIRREIKRSQPSPYSLWNSAGGHF